MKTLFFSLLFIDFCNAFGSAASFLFDDDHELQALNDAEDRMRTHLRRREYIADKKVPRYVPETLCNDDLEEKRIISAAEAANKRTKNANS